MAGLSLTIDQHKQRRRRLILIWWNQVVTTLSLLVLLLYMLMIKHVMTRKKVKKRKNIAKARVKGNRVKSVVEMERGVNMGEEQDGDFEVSHSDGTSSSFHVAETSSVQSKKRKRTSQADLLLQSFNDAVVLFADRIKEFSAAFSEDIKLEVEIKKKTLMIPSELAKMTSLTQLERFRAIDKMKDQSSATTFWSLGEEEREAWVRFLLNEKTS